MTSFLPLPGRTMWNSNRALSAKSKLSGNRADHRPMGLLIGYLIVTVLLAIIAVGALIIAPQFALLFESFGADLPFVSRLFVASTTYWGVLPVISTIIAYDLWRRRILTRRYEMLLMITLAVFTIFVIAIIPVSVVVFYLPIFKLAGA
jgi:hypothetical protein